MGVHNVLELTETPRELVITVREGCADALDDCESIEDALEHQLCNGWSRIAPEECGALTDGLIITREDERNDHGELVKLGTVYWNANYQVTDALEELKAKGRVTFTRCD